MHVPQELSSIIGVLAGEEGLLGGQGGIKKKEQGNKPGQLAPLANRPAAGVVMKGPDGLPLQPPKHDPSKQHVMIRAPMGPGHHLLPPHLHDDGNGDEHSHHHHHRKALAPPSKKKEYVPPPVVLLVQQTGPKSVEMLLNWVLGDPHHPQAGTPAQNEALDHRLTRFLNKCWEGALFEYLRHVGHPVRTLFVDPRAAVKTLWYNGGLISNMSGFTPHFVIREVKQR